MEREVIFRGKRLGNGQWLYGDLMHDNHQGCYVYPNDCTGLYTENKVDPDTVGEFTNMKDKHGNKVFEGDIVEYGRSLYVCEFVEGGFTFRDISDDRLTLNAILIEADVIGNVYDNSELLPTK